MPVRNSLDSHRIRASLWVPSAERIARARLTAFMRAVETPAGSRSPPTTTSIASRSSVPRTSGGPSGRSPAFGARWAARVVDDLGKMPGARFFPDARLNFAENLLRRRGTAPAIIFNGEGQRAAHAQPRGAACGGRAMRRGAPRGGHSPGRPRRRLHAEHARDDRRGARRGGDRRRVVVVLAGLRRAGRAGSLRPDRAAGADRRRRLLLRREDARRHAAARRHRRGAPVDRADGDRPVRRATRRRSTRVPRRRRVGGVPRHGRRRRRSSSSRSRSITRSTSCIRPARPASRSASCTAPAAR